MAAGSQSQHRCVFVGNIPYDATEEQLIQICEEVGPVVSFRLVIDRETGKPKGYGFCEYKDEETALSARRNLQGYEINGRQLRVDFAENDKNADKNHQGRATALTNTGQAAVGDPNLFQPLGDSIAMTAANVMAGVLGAAQISSTSNQIGLQPQSLLGIDPLTSHLAKMSRSQLADILSELKALATQNKEQARQLLFSIPNLPKALFQAQIMLGIVSPQTLQIENIRQAYAQTINPVVQSVQTLPGLPPLPQNKQHTGVLLPSHESQVPTSALNQYATITHMPAQTQIQRSQLISNQILHQGQLLGQSGVSSIPSVRPQSLSGSLVRPSHIHVPATTSLNQEAQPSMLHVGHNPPAKFVDDNHAIGFQSRSSLSSALPQNMDLKGVALNSLGKSSMVNNNIVQMNRASKLVKLNDGRSVSSSQDVNMDIHVSGASQKLDLSGRKTSVAEESLKAEKQTSQMQLPSDVDAAMLEQVLNLTPEQLSSLPPDQQQQVIQLQKMLRQTA